MSKTCFITIGHVGRPSRPNDVGASYEAFVESEGVRLYVAGIRAHLDSQGWVVMISDKGEYATQKAAADQANATVYLNCHLNAGMGGRDVGSNRGEYFYDHQSAPQNGPALCRSIASSVTKDLGIPSAAKRCRPDTNGVPRDDDFAEAYNCIRNVRAIACCSEPFFIDGPDRERLRSPATLHRIGLAIGAGIESWYAGRMD